MNINVKSLLLISTFTVLLVACLPGEIFSAGNGQVYVLIPKAPGGICPPRGVYRLTPKIAAPAGFPSDTSQPAPYLLFDPVFPDKDSAYGLSVDIYGTIYTFSRADGGQPKAAELGWRPGGMFPPDSPIFNDIEGTWPPGHGTSHRLYRQSVGSDKYGNSWVWKHDPYVGPDGPVYQGKSGKVILPAGYYGISSKGYNAQWKRLDPNVNTVLIPYTTPHRGGGHTSFKANGQFDPSYYAAYSNPGAWPYIVTNILRRYDFTAKPLDLWGWYEEPRTGAVRNIGAWERTKTYPTGEDPRRLGENVMESYDVDVRQTILRGCGDGCIPNGSVDTSAIGSFKAPVEVVSCSSGRVYGFNSLDRKLTMTNKNGQKTTLPLNNNTVINWDYFHNKQGYKVTDIKHVGSSIDYDVSTASGNPDYLYVSSADSFAVSDQWWGSGGKAYEYFDATGHIYYIDYSSAFKDFPVSQDLGSISRYAKSVDNISIDGLNRLYIMATEVDPPNSPAWPNESGQPNVPDTMVSPNSYPFSTNPSSPNYHPMYLSEEDGLAQGAPTGKKILSFKQDVWKKVSRFDYDQSGRLGNKTVINKVWAGYDVIKRTIEVKGGLKKWVNQWTHQDKVGGRQASVKGEVAVVNLATRPSIVDNGGVIDIVNTLASGLKVVTEDEPSTWTFEGSFNYKSKTTIYAFNDNPPYYVDLNKDGKAGGLPSNTFQKRSAADLSAYDWQTEYKWEVKQLKPIPRSYSTVGDNTPVLTHTFADPGKYRVRLTVRFKTLDFSQAKTPSNISSAMESEVRTAVGTNDITVYAKIPDNITSYLWGINVVPSEMTIDEDLEPSKQGNQRIQASCYLKFVRDKNLSSKTAWLKNYDGIGMFDYDDKIVPAGNSGAYPWKYSYINNNQYVGRFRSGNAAKGTAVGDLIMGNVHRAPTNLDLQAIKYLWYVEYTNPEADSQDLAADETRGLACGRLDNASVTLETVNETQGIYKVTVPLDTTYDGTALKADAAKTVDEYVFWVPLERPAGQPGGFYRLYIKFFYPKVKWEPFYEGDKVLWNNLGSAGGDSADSKNPLLCQDGNVVNGYCDVTVLDITSPTVQFEAPNGTTGDPLKGEDINFLCRDNNPNSPVLAGEDSPHLEFFTYQFEAAENDLRDSKLGLTKGTLGVDISAASYRENSRFPDRENVEWTYTYGGHSDFNYLDLTGALDKVYYHSLAEEDDGTGKPTAETDYNGDGFLDGSYLWINLSPHVTKEESSIKFSWPDGKIKVNDKDIVILDLNGPDVERYTAAYSAKGSIPSDALCYSETKYSIPAPKIVMPAFTGSVKLLGKSTDGKDLSAVSNKLISVVDNDAPNAIFDVVPSNAQYRFAVIGSLADNQPQETITGDTIGAVVQEIISITGSSRIRFKSNPEDVVLRSADEQDQEAILSFLTDSEENEIIAAIIKQMSETSDDNKSKSTDKSEFLLDAINRSTRVSSPSSLLPELHEDVRFRLKVKVYDNIDQETGFTVLTALDKNREVFVNFLENGSEGDETREFTISMEEIFLSHEPFDLDAIYTEVVDKQGNKRRFIIPVKVSDTSIKVFTLREKTGADAGGQTDTDSASADDDDESDESAEETSDE